MLYRDHRGSLADSMKTVIELPATLSALAEHLSKSEGISVKPKWVTVEDAIAQSAALKEQDFVAFAGDFMGGKLSIVGVQKDRAWDLERMEK